MKFHNSLDLSSASGALIANGIRSLRPKHCTLTSNNIKGMVHRLIIYFVLFVPFGLNAQSLNPKPNWTDSYAAGNLCWCESSFDHGLSEKTVRINGQDFKIVDICDELKKHPAYRPIQNSDPKYNDIQCGNGPANDAADEVDCPGRVDLGNEGCNEIGPKWDMSWLSKRTRFGGSNPAYDIWGELKKWHKVTLTFDGPYTSETASPNPFSDYNLVVTFSQGPKKYEVLGFYAADGNAAETSTTEGNKWQVHFAPDEIGTWYFSVSFKTGTNVAVNNGGTSAGFMDGLTGNSKLLLLIKQESIIEQKVG